MSISSLTIQAKSVWFLNVSLGSRNIMKLLSCFAKLLKEHVEGNPAWRILSPLNELDCLPPLIIFRFMFGMCLMFNIFPDVRVNIHLAAFCFIIIGQTFPRECLLRVSKKLPRVKSLLYNLLFEAIDGRE